MEAKAYKNVTEYDVIKFIKETIVHRFGLPQSITVDNGMDFNGSRVLAFAQEYGVKILNFTPYYAQANGQAEFTNKIIKANLRKVVNNNPSNWDELLSKVIWAYRTSKKISINTTPFSLVYGHDAVLPVEVTIQSLRVARQNQLSHTDYEDAMMAEMDDLDEAQVAALNSIILQKQRVIKNYNRRVRHKTFAKETWFGK